MPWTPFHASGRGWVPAGAEATADPYLVWAEATGWAHLGRPGAGAPAQANVLVELLEGQTPQQLQAALGTHGRVTPAYLQQDTRWCTANFDAAACRRFAGPDNGFVARFELTQPVVPARPPRLRPSAPGVNRRGRVAARSSGETLLGVIDTGCAFAHRSFQRSGRTRVLSLWDQDDDPAFGVAPALGAVPEGFGYGREVSRTELQALADACRRGGAVDEGRCYELARYPELRRAATHGTAVMDLLLGPLRAGDRLAFDPRHPPQRLRDGRRATDRADLVFVQLPRLTWGDPNGLALSARVFDGLEHILRCAGPNTRRVVVNISCATYTGPHNGTPIFDAALRALVARESRRGRELEIFMPAGNSHQSQWHAAGRVGSDEPAELTLQVAPGCESPSFVQLWVDAPPSAVRWSVRAPGAPAAVALRHPCEVYASDARPRAVALRSSSRARGWRCEGGTLLMLALAGSDSPDSPGAGGLWRLQVQLAPDRPQQAAVEVYVARNESELGCPPRHRPARLVDPSCDPQRYLREAEADPAVAGRPRLMVLRAGTASAQVSGGAPYGVGALRLRPVERPAPYSSAGLGALSGSSLADESLNVPGLTVAGTRSASLQRMQGTSFACPQMARVAADRDSAVPGQRSRRPGPTEIRRVTGGTDRLGQVVTVPRRG